MFVFPQLPEGYVGVVHETDIIIARGRECDEVQGNGGIRLT